METPERLSTYFKKHCQHADIIKLEYFDHYNILTDGQHQIIHQLIGTIKDKKHIVDSITLFYTHQCHVTQYMLQTDIYLLARSATR